MRTVLSTSLVMAALLGGTAMGQTARQIDRHVAEMRRVLHLSGKQAGTIRADYFAASNEKRIIQGNPNVSQFEKERRIREVIKSTNEEIEAVLAPKQIETLKNYHFKSNDYLNLP